MSSSPHPDPNVPSLRPNKRRKSSYESASDGNTDTNSNPDPLDIINTYFPKDKEPDILCLIFGLGLINSSPKVLMSYMPGAMARGLSSEHIKSHLQKYRIHHERSKEEFLSYYDKYIKERFNQFEQSREWETDGSPYLLDQQNSDAMLPNSNSNGNLTTTSTVDSPHISYSNSTAVLASMGSDLSANKSSSNGMGTSANLKRPLNESFASTGVVSSNQLRQKQLALQQADELLREWAHTQNENLLSQEKACLLFLERTQQANSHRFTGT